ncbi:hypothetical protein [Aeromonas dhakensis]|uniref:hypothetical protein n=1 Tax=Aeromonas dhakensis TaxID=196024 RepID=UPI003B9E6E25
MSTYELVKYAILNKKQIIAEYQGHYREMCPHAIGTKNGYQQALFYQFGGSSSKGIVTPDSIYNWRCLRLKDLNDVQVRDGEWFTAANHSQAQTCIDVVECEVTF